MDEFEFYFDRVVRETEMATLYEADNEEHWIPKSQIVEEWDDHVIIPEWLATEKGLT